ncbi:dihydropteroate synthase [Streptomyces sp. NPDC002130]|uniref:dihydropteroate synthase n=1 Tax=Streptomyces sp. NPDC002130 TaxID=3155568 RepID=UPI00331AB0B7
MGIVNVTPDSFSDGGRWFAPERAVAHGLALLVNDVSGGLADPAMLPLMARAGTPYVLMHWRGHSADMQANAVYTDVVADVADVVDELRARVEAALSAGIPPDCLIVDPGLGFAKHAEDNWRLLGRLREVIAALGRPVLVGAARKAFLGHLLRDPETGRPRPAHLQDAATSAVSVLAAAQGAWCVRVHDVASTADAVRVAARWGLENASTPPPKPRFCGVPSSDLRFL